MTCVTPRAASLSAGAPPMKSGSAIGIGCTSPEVISTLTAAGAERGQPRPSAPAPAPSASNRRRVIRGGKTERSLSRMVRLGLKSAAVQIVEAETQIDVFPHLVFRGGKGVGLAPPHRAQRAFGEPLEVRTRAALEQPRRGRQRAVDPELHVHVDTQVLGVGGAGRRVSTAPDLC